MRIIIIEDEAPIAAYIEDSVRRILESKIRQLTISYTCEEGLELIMEKEFDLCFLDLNLRGKSGYEILQKAASRPLHTIIISAHTEHAARAFDFGVIDFVPKPFTLERLRQAIERFLGAQRTPAAAKYLSYRVGQKNCLLQVSEISHIKACRYLAEVWLPDERRVLLEKPLNRLEQILPDDFIRIHRSYIVNLKRVESFQHHGSSRYTIRMKGGQALPLSRDRLRALKKLLQEN
jgi:DNA-binding LytR/AlgR family response regulator